MARHKNIPIFIAHRGCPNQCVFCNQKTISQSEEYSLADIKNTIEDALLHAKEDDAMEIAFFGGSFTGIERSEMISLLTLANEYLQKKKIVGIRLSTRPDYISNEILDILEAYGVTDIELGVQSLSDTVLGACRRGHTKEQTLDACRMILARQQFSLVGQMMLGLPSSTKEEELQTAAELFALGVHAIRIYPTIVLANTPLADSQAKGEYTPLSLEDAVCRAAEIIEMAERYGVPCLRIGLCENESLHQSGGMIQGPFHPAFGELVAGKIFLRKMERLLASTDCRDREITFYIPMGARSKAAGHKNQNLNLLYHTFQPKRIRFSETADLSGYCVSIGG